MSYKEKGISRGKLVEEPKPLKLKVLRGELAKEFPMIQIAKAGDVGLDLPVALPFRDGYEKKLKDYIDGCERNNVVPDEDMINIIKHGRIAIYPGDRHLIPTDIRIELPEGYWASIEARSSTSKQSLIVPKGVIDEGYRGQLFAQVINVGKTVRYISHGDRLVQLILHERQIKDFDIIEVDELSESERGESGFGSTGSSVLK